MNADNISSLLTAILALDRACFISYDVGLEPEQVECLGDPARNDECLAMLDDMEARLQLDVADVRAAILERWALDHADDLREDGSAP